MADQSGAVIIRDQAGTEHEFPPGFDPQRAAEIVRRQTTDPIPPRGGQPIGSHEISDGPAPPPSPLLEMLGPLAHPQTLVDFARLLTLPVDSVKKAVVGALSMSAARNAVPSGAAVKDATGRALQAAGDFDLTHPLKSTAGKLGDALVESAEEARTASRPGYPRSFSTPAPAPAEVPPPVAPAAAATPATTDEFTVARAAKNALPDQKALNEAALAARRAAYQASLQPSADAVVPASGKLHFTAPEWAAFRALRDRGVSLEDAATGAKAAGELARKFGLSQPTLEQTQFPKGARR